MIVFLTHGEIQMENVSQLQSKVSALESENQSLKSVIEHLQAKVTTMNQTLSEVLNANIEFKTGCAVLEKREASLNQKILEMNNEIECLKSSNVAAEA